MIVNKLESKDVRIIVEEGPNKTSQLIEVREGKKWTKIIRSYKGFSTIINFLNKQASSNPCKFQKGDQEELNYKSINEDYSVDSNFRLIGNNMFHFSYLISNHKDRKLSKLIACYEILLDRNPDYTWVPHVCPRKNYVIGDHVFRSPVIIYGKKNLFFALIPDLHLLANNYNFKMFLDFTVKENELGENPYIAYGFGNYKPSRHILFKHEQKKNMEIGKGVKFSFGYYVKIFSPSDYNQVLKETNQILWNTYGRDSLYKNLNPQVVPYNKNVEEGFKSIFERHKAWGDFEINGVPCGGFWQKSYIGIKKVSFRYLSQEKLLETIPIEVKDITPYSGADAAIWNNAWFMNIRSGYSLKYFGKLWNDNDLMDKGNKILNTLLSLPRMNGFFPSLIYPSAPNTKEISTINGLKGFIKTHDFNMVDVSLAMYWALKFYQDFDDKNEQILIKSKALISFIEKVQLTNGSIPIFVNFDNSESIPTMRDELIESASSGAVLMFILECYKVTKEPNILSIAESITRYLLTEVLPYDKWHDFEVFFSCTNQPFNAYDKRTKSHYMNTLSIYWCVEGLKELFKITNNRTYLDAGERVLATLSLFQQVWNMPYINFNTYGGFCSQNSDAELNDARTALFVRTYMEYYLETGNKEYMERGIAALRACWALQLLREYQEQCPGNLEGISELDGVDRGGIFENYGHYGKDVRVQELIEFDWGIGSAATATAYTKEHFGDLFIDFKEQIVWGIDGILIKSFDFGTNRIDITCDFIGGKKDVIVRLRDASINPVEVYLNGKFLGISNEFDFNLSKVFKLD